MKKRMLSPDEEKLWAQVTRGVDPLTGRARNQALPDKQIKSAEPLQNHARPGAGGGAKKPLNPKPVHQPPPSLPPVRTTPSESLSNLERKDKQRVRRGTIEVDAKIDLHGMRQVEAHQALIHRVTEARLRGHRVLLVVTGKGLGKDLPRDGSTPFWMRGGGVLRQQVPLWLSEEPLRSLIFSVQQAHQRHGGSGALYVFLKRL